MRRYIAATLLLLVRTTHAQFGNDLLQNNSYWGDGKAEFNIYDAQIVRDGQPRKCEVLHIFVREALDPKQLVRVQEARAADSIAVLKLNQILFVPTGLYVWQQMHSTAWRVDNGALLKFSLTSSDSSGNAYKEARRNGETMAYEYRSYLDGNGNTDVDLPANGWFYDELPWRVRTFDFRRPSGEAEVQLAASVMHPKKDDLIFKPAKASFKSTERQIEVVVQHERGADRFVLDSNFPYLLREWSAWDGNHLKMKRNLKVDYWNYGKNGDRERGFTNPMLRLPD